MNRQETIWNKRDKWGGKLMASIPISNDTGQTGDLIRFDLGVNQFVIDNKRPLLAFGELCYSFAKRHGDHYEKRQVWVYREDSMPEINQVVEQIERGPELLTRKKLYNKLINLG